MSQPCLNPESKLGHQCLPQPTASPFFSPVDSSSDVAVEFIPVLLLPSHPQFKSHDSKAEVICQLICYLPPLLTLQIHTVYSHLIYLGRIQAVIFQITTLKPSVACHIFSSTVKLQPIKVTCLANGNLTPIITCLYSPMPSMLSPPRLIISKHI